MSARRYPRLIVALRSEWIRLVDQPRPLPFKSVAYVGRHKAAVHIQMPRRPSMAVCSAGTKFSDELSESMIRRFGTVVIASQAEMVENAASTSGLELWVSRRSNIVYRKMLNRFLSA